MNYYYIDPTATSSGNGTIASPYRSFTALISAGIIHPCIIYLKRGTTLCENANFGVSGLANTTGTMSYIDCYGSGPLPIWLNKKYVTVGTALDGYTYSGMHITARNTQNITIQNIEFYTKNDLTVVDNNPSSFLWLELPAATTEISANVWVNQCKFHGDPIIRSGKHTWYESVVNIKVNANATNRVNYFGVRYCDFYNVSRPINIVGNHWTADDITNNATGTYYSRGVKVEHCSMVGISKGGCQFAGVESKNSAYVVDVDQSVMRDISYSKYRWDNALENSDTLYADAGFWTYRCNRVMLENIRGGGMWPSVTDNELIDFDYLSWDCVARYNIGFNNAASILFMGHSSTTSQGGSRAAYSSYSSTYTQAQWFYERRNGQGNNIVEFCYFFNDGVQTVPAPSTGYGGCANIRSGNINYSNIVRNCVFVDTVSTTMKYLVSNNNLALTAGEPYRLSIENCVYYSRYNNGTDLITPLANTTTYSAAATKMTNLIAMSAAWASANYASVLSTLSTNCTVNNARIVDPLFRFVPAQPPVSVKSALKISVTSDSPCIHSGASSGNLDITGKACSDIFWRSLS